MRQSPVFVVTIALAAVGGQACSSGERAQGGPEATTNGAGIAAAERQIITLTGCLERDVQPGTFALVGVATAGAIDGSSPREQHQARAQQGGQNAGADAEASTASLAAGTDYRLIATEADQGQEMAQYENQRVAVRGRLAAEVPVGTAGSNQAPAEGTVVESSETNATVRGTAPPLRGFHVESVRKVGESCSGR